MHLRWKFSKKAIIPDLNTKQQFLFFLVLDSIPNLFALLRGAWVSPRGRRVIPVKDLKIFNAESSRLN